LRLHHQVHEVIQTFARALQRIGFDINGRRCEIRSSDDVFKPCLELDLVSLPGLIPLTRGRANLLNKELLTDLALNV